MPKADRVHSTPPTNMPIDTKRRRFLSVAAGGAVVDPIYAAIERHREAAAIWDAAVDVWAKFPDGPKPMPIERRIERERINDAWRDARDALDDAGVDLINTSPTALHGVARALNFIREQVAQEDGVYMPSGLVLKGSDYPEIIGWIGAFLDTIEYAARELDLASRSGMRRSYKKRHRQRLAAHSRRLRR